MENVDKNEGSWLGGDMTQSSSPSCTQASAVPSGFEPVQGLYLGCKQLQVEFDFRVRTGEVPLAFRQYVPGDGR